MKTNTSRWCQSAPRAALLGLFIWLSAAAGSATAVVTIRCPTNITVWTCGTNQTVQYPPPVVTSDCGFNTTALFCQPPSGSLFPVGTTTVSCEVRDNCGGQDRCTFTVTVIRDTNAPSIRCPTNITVQTCEPNGVKVEYPAPVVADDHSVTITVDCVPPSGSFFPYGTNMVICTARDECGNLDRCTFNVAVVRDTIDPVIHCPSNITVRTCSPNGVIVNYPAPTATDNVDNSPTISCDPPSGSLFPVGTTGVVCVARDDCSNIGRCTFTVTVVRDTNAPTIRCPTNVVAWTCSSNGVVVNYPPPPVVVDDHDPNPTVSCTPPSGSMFPPGTTTVICEAIDNCGNRDRCTFTVTVLRDARPPEIRCPRDIVWCVTNGTVVTYTVGAVDNADATPTIVCNPPSGSVFPLGTTAVTCRAVDDCGNESRCRFTVTLVKDEKPVLGVSKEGHYLIICWQKTCGCYQLQGTRTLSPPVLWVDVLDVPDDLGDRYCLRYPIEGGMRYFRLIQCERKRAPTFTVTSTGITSVEVGRLADALNLGRNDIILHDGAALFVDSRNFQALPMQRIQDPEVIAELMRGTEDQDGLVFNGLDFEGLRNLRVLDPNVAVNRFMGALRAADLLPAMGEPIATHTIFDAVDTQGHPMVDETPLDTHVNYKFDLGGIPLSGPGAKVGIAFGPNGNPTALHYAMRKLEPGMDVALIPIEEAARRCQRLYPQLQSAGQPRLMYFAPPLSLRTVQRLVPCFECGGNAPVGEDNVQLLRTIIPATDDPALVPTVGLEVSAAGNLVSARATVQGGTPPYSYEWLSSSADLSDVPPNASNIQYRAEPRGDEVLERVRVMVTDANGVQVQADAIVTVSGSPTGGSLAASPLLANTMAVSGTIDFGIERAVSDMGSAQQSGFKNRFLSSGATKRFNFTGPNCWERDFKEGGNGLDQTYADNADIVFYIGHGNGGGFTFESEQDDNKVTYLDVPGAWGDRDIEWLALLSCEVLRDTYNSKKWNERWGPAFDGLHLLLGFETWDPLESTCRHASLSIL